MKVTLPSIFLASMMHVPAGMPDGGTLGTTSYSHRTVTSTLVSYLVLVQYCSTNVIRRYERVSVQVGVLSVVLRIYLSWPACRMHIGEFPSRSLPGTRYLAWYRYYAIRPVDYQVPRSLPGTVQGTGGWVPVTCRYSGELRRGRSRAYYYVQSVTHHSSIIICRA